NESSALEMKADALTNLGRRPEALSAYEEAAAIDPKDDNLRQKIEEVRVDVPGLLSRALIASASGNYPQALNLFDDILEVEPSNVNALIGNAVAYRRSGQPEAEPRARGREDGPTGHLPGPRPDQGDREDAGEGPDRRRLPECGGLREGEPEGPHGREGHHPEDRGGPDGAFPRLPGGSPLTRVGL